MGYQVKTLEERPLGQAMWRGTLCKCPNCGEGKMFRAYLKVNDACPECGEELHHHRADDGPPYIAIMIVGHILIFIMLHLELVMQVNPLVYLYTLVPLAVVMPLAMLPSIKGFLVGLQWANRMHGFDPDHRDPALPDPR
ncbi:DUF983 domain-containing protein [Arsenicitalea aurantiaca]|uniref:DUF983 domain-containing protein n=1 Tax=Arsenicitalea aurantiaca TaxID=1783274 RepID=A0A433XFR1_9HYPH|nr:DUF983 domain-containing protein [Arsenicitalea aurantiaca]RUT32939.1 DUF983 domain-containing protein [Arsenicitalea aurantiaca]